MAIHRAVWPGALLVAQPLDPCRGRGHAGRRSDRHSLEDEEVARHRIVAAVEVSILDEH